MLGGTEPSPRLDPHKREHLGHFGFENYM